MSKPSPGPLDRRLKAIGVEMQAKGAEVFERFRKRLNLIMNRDQITAGESAERARAEILEEERAAKRRTKKIVHGRVV